MMSRRRALVALATVAVLSTDPTWSFLPPASVPPSSRRLSSRRRQRRSEEHSNPSSALYQAKPKKQVNRANDDDGDGVSTSTTIPDGTIPANLRRKVTAKRPTLGHVVPKSVRDRQKRTEAGGSQAPQLRAQGQARVDGSINNPGMLKIMGGTCRGRRLDSPQVFLRPMMGKVKEAVFSTFTAFGLYENNFCRHLDIFAGSGSVGLESLSRGATHCTFVDLSDDCCSCIQRNLDLTGFNKQDSSSGADQHCVVCADAITALTQPTTVGIPEGSTYQIVTLCPPYEEVVYGDLLEAVVGSDLVTDDTIILVEYPVELGCLPHVVSARKNTAVGVRNRRYGRTIIALYVVNPTGTLSDTANSRPEEFVQM